MGECMVGWLVSRWVDAGLEEWMDRWMDALVCPRHLSGY